MQSTIGYPQIWLGMSGWVNLADPAGSDWLGQAMPSDPTVTKLLEKQAQIWLTESEQVDLANPAPQTQPSLVTDLLFSSVLTNSIQCIFNKITTETPLMLLPTHWNLILQKVK